MFKKILLVDKDHSGGQRIEAALAAKGIDFRLTSVSGWPDSPPGDKDHFDLIILMPKKQAGLDLSAPLVAIKQSFPETPIIIFATEFDLNAVIGLFRDGATDCLTTRASDQELAERLNAVLSREFQSAKSGWPMSQLAQKDKQVTEMLMAMAHDVRSPLLAMLNRSKLLIKGRFGLMDDRVVNELDKIDLECRKMLGMADEYLDKLFNLHQGEAQEKRLINLGRDVVESIFDELAQEIKKNRITVQGLPADSLAKVTVRACPVNLKTVFRNLLTNAIKYGGQNCSIGVDVQKKLGCYRISIFNNGPVITEDKCFQLFSTSTFCRNRNSRKGEGAGVGLNLSRRIVLEHGGDLWYENINDMPHFVFTLPHEISLSDRALAQPKFGIFKPEELPPSFQNRPMPAKLFSQINRSAL